MAEEMKRYFFRNCNISILNTFSTEIVLGMLSKTLNDTLEGSLHE